MTPEILKMIHTLHLVKIGEHTGPEILEIMEEAKLVMINFDHLIYTISFEYNDDVLEGVFKITPNGDVVEIGYSL